MLTTHGSSGLEVHSCVDKLKVLDRTVDRVLSSRHSLSYLMLNLYALPAALNSALALVWRAS